MDIKVHCAHSEMMGIERVIPNPKNPNTHDKKQIALLAKIIQAQGWRAPITISKRSGFIVRGHGRLAAAISLGLEKVPVDIQDYASDAEEWADLIADNRLAELSRIDKDVLGQLLSELDSDMGEFTGFSSEEIETLIASATRQEVTDDDYDLEGALEEVENKHLSQLGDIWYLGEHRLLCGDSANIDEVKRLLGGDLADMIFTDPPYNVAYEGKTGDALTIKNDNMSEEEFTEFLDAVCKCLSANVKKGGAIYVCHADLSTDVFRYCFRKNGFLLKQCLIWVKNGMVLGRRDYQLAHETILYGWKAGASHKWYGGRKQTTVIDDRLNIEIEQAEDGNYYIHFQNEIDKVTIKVPSYEVVQSIDDSLTTIWRFNKPLRNDAHPTMKPIQLCARGIQNSSKEGDIVLEPFGGSGSTLIACEQTNRKCRAVELDERYCDVIIKRYIEFVGESKGVSVIRGGEIFTYDSLAN